MILYAIFASYFAGVMVRLMLTLTPVVCVLAAIAFSRVFEIYLKDDSPKPRGKAVEESQNNRGDKMLYDKVRRCMSKIMFVLILFLSLAAFVVLLICSLYWKQYGPRSDCSLRSN